MSKKINCIILDDEPLAVQLISDYASRLSQLHVVYAGSDAFKAIEHLQAETVDLVFIDIQMPQLTGIELMQLFNQKHNFIITSAYPQYALDAYQFHVIDFLLKPVTFARFYQGVEKYQRWQDTFQQADTEDSYLLVKSDRKQYRIATETIQYIEGLKDYIRIHTDTEKIMVLENLKDILTRLPGHKFVRIHRSYIIPKKGIKVIEGNQIRMANGTWLPIGETYRKQTDEWLR